MKKIQRMWLDHIEILALTFPSLPSLCLNLDDRDDLELLDFYIVDCIEAFVDKGELSPRSIVLLYECKRDLVRYFKKLGGAIDENGYFKQLLMLSKEVLRHVSVKEARLIIARNAKRERGETFSHADIAL
jgi:hypothetical protein